MFLQPEYETLTFVVDVQNIFEQEVSSVGNDREGLEIN